MSDAAWREVPPGQSYTSHAERQANGRRCPEDLHILIVDDSEDGAKSLAMLFWLWGADAKACCSGPEALEAALANPPDALLSEISLPRMDGGELVRRLREREELRKTLLIAVTAWADKHSRRVAQEAGFDYFYVKPLGCEDIQEILAETERFKE